MLHYTRATTSITASASPGIAKSRRHGRLEDGKGIVTAALESLLCRLPVDDLPDVLDVGGLAVLVL